MELERRPIAARRLPIVISLAQALARAGVTPNTISVVGMIACTLAGACFFLTARAELAHLERWLWAIGALLVQLRLQCNMLDGMVAIEGGKTSRVGELYNELPDRVSDICTLVGLGYALHSRPELGYLAATLAVLTAYVRAAAKVAGAPQDYCGPMAKQHRMFVVTLLSLFMALAPDAWRSWVSPALATAGSWWQSAPALALWIICVGSLATCLRRTARAARALNAAPPAKLS
jgi:phosphatidylglycerophosphate synthase